MNKYIKIKRIKLARFKSGVIWNLDFFIGKRDFNTLVSGHPAKGFPNMLIYVNQKIFIKRHE